MTATPPADDTAAEHASAAATTTPIFVDRFLWQGQEGMFRLYFGSTGVKFVDANGEGSTVPPRYHAQIVVNEAGLIALRDMLHRIVTAPASADRAPETKPDAAR